MLEKIQICETAKKQDPQRKGHHGQLVCLLSRAAFRKGIGSYCGFRNPVTPRMWAGGIVGLKSILGVKRHPHAMYTMTRLENMGYISYDSQTEITPPSKECVVRIWELIRIRARNTHTEGTDNQRINRFVAWRSREVSKNLEEKAARNESGKSSDYQDGSENCVADLDTITRAYFSHGRNCKHSRNCISDCLGLFIGKGIFFDDDNFEHMACGIVADWGEPGRTEVRICDFEDLKKCEIFR